MNGRSMIPQPVPFFRAAEFYRIFSYNANQ